MKEAHHMKHASRILLALVLVPFLLPLLQAATTVLATYSNLSQINGTTVATGAGASNAGTLRVMLSSDSSLTGLTVNIGAQTGGALAVTSTSTVTFPKMNGLGQMRHAMLVEVERRP